MGVLDLVHLDPLEAGGPLGPLFREQGEHGAGAVEEVGEIEGVSLGEVGVIGVDGFADGDVEATHGQGREGGEGEFLFRAVGFHLRELLEEGVRADV